MKEKSERQTLIDERNNYLRNRNFIIEEFNEALLDPNNKHSKALLLRTIVEQIEFIEVAKRCNLEYIDIDEEQKLLNDMTEKFKNANIISS